jgi:hypothetical protein
LKVRFLPRSPFFSTGYECRLEQLILGSGGLKFSVGTLIIFKGLKFRLRVFFRLLHGTFRGTGRKRADKNRLDHLGSQMPGETFIQIEGSGFRADAKFLKKQFERPSQLRNQLKKYVLANLVQSAQNAACNRLHTIAERLAGRCIFTRRFSINTELLSAR